MPNNGKPRKVIHENRKRGVEPQLTGWREVPDFGTGKSNKVEHSELPDVRMWCESLDDRSGWSLKDRALRGEGCTERKPQRMQGLLLSSRPRSNQHISMRETMRERISAVSVHHSQSAGNSTTTQMKKMFHHPDEKKKLFTGHWVLYAEGHCLSP